MVWQNPVRLLAGFFYGTLWKGVNRLRKNKKRDNQKVIPKKMEAASGFEPLNNGFADHCLSHLATPPVKHVVEPEIINREHFFDKQNMNWGQKVSGLRALFLLA